MNDVTGELVHFLAILPYQIDGVIVIELYVAAVSVISHQYTQLQLFQWILSFATLEAADTILHYFLIALITY